MLSPSFIPESVFYTQSVMLSPRFIPESVFYTQSVVRNPQSMFYTDHAENSLFPALDPRTGKKLFFLYNW